MRKIMISLILLLPVLLMAVGFEPLERDDIAQLVDMLSFAELDSCDLAFEKDWDLSTRFKLDSQMRVLQNPWSGFDEIARWREMLGSASADGLVDTMFKDLEPMQDMPLAHAGTAQNYQVRLAKAGNSPKKLTKIWSEILNELIPEFKGAFSKLNPSQLDSLRAFWYLACSEGEDSEKYEQYIQSRGLPILKDIELQDFASLFEKVDFISMRQAALSYLAATEALETQATRLKFPRKKPLYVKTRHGYAVFGTPSDDVYKPIKGKPICLILDPAGNDRYQIPIKADVAHPFFTLIDFEGDDIYISHTPGQLFTAELGILISKDLSGADLYQGDDFSFASYLGLCLHIDDEGDDVYRAGTFSQAAALFGAAILIDKKGNDRYDAPSQSQGLASTKAIAILADKAGDDVYYLGGKYYHAPLMPLDHRTLGQGMGFGFRPDYAGGIGILYDKDGNDRYLGGVYAQGVGYWYGMGMLIDEAGNDVYSAVYYPQGSGIHLACGLLYDGGGDDAYYSRNGPGQGAAHDWGLGIMIDASGNDAYSIQGGQGLGLSNSVAIFVDRAGDDRYERKEVQNYGSGAFSRGTGSIGLFLDAGGKDSYPDSLKTNDDTWINGTYGIGRDIDMRPTEKTAVEELSESAELPAADEPIEEIFKVASEWEVGSAIQRVRAARKIMIERKDEAIPYVLEHKLNTRSGLEFRALEALYNEAPEMSPLLIPFIHKADSLAAKNAISLLASKADSLLVPELERLLQEGKYLTACLSVLAAFETPESIAILSQWLNHPQERFRYIAARSLAQIDLPEARAALREKAVNPSFLLKAILRKLPEDESHER